MDGAAPKPTAAAACKAAHFTTPGRAQHTSRAEARGPTRARARFNSGSKDSLLQFAPKARADPSAPVRDARNAGKHGIHVSVVTRLVAFPVVVRGKVNVPQNGIDIVSLHSDIVVLAALARRHAFSSQSHASDYGGAGAVPVPLAAVPLG